MLTDLAARVARIEAKLWPPDTDPTPGQPLAAPTMAEYGGVWPVGKRLSDGGKVWVNKAGVPLTTAPSGFPGTPGQWAHLFIEVTTGEDPGPGGGDTPPEWSASATYKVGDRVTRGGIVYECLVGHGPEYQGTWGPPQASVWKVIG